MVFAALPSLTFLEVVGGKMASLSIRNLLARHTLNIDGVSTRDVGLGVLDCPKLVSFHLTRCRLVVPSPLMTQLTDLHLTPQNQTVSTSLSVGNVFVLRLRNLGIRKYFVSLLTTFVRDMVESH